MNDLVSDQPIEVLPERSVRALIISAHDVTRIGFGVLLRRERWVQRCLLAADRSEAAAHLARHRPQVAILDVSDVVPFVAPAVARMHEVHRGVQVVLTTRCERTAPLVAERHGAGTTGWSKSLIMAPDWVRRDGCPCWELVSRH